MSTKKKPTPKKSESTKAPEPAKLALVGAGCPTVDVTKISLELGNARGAVGDVGDLMDSITAVGLLQPPVLLVEESPKGPTYKVIAGFRRVEAIKKLAAAGKYPKMIPYMPYTRPGAPAGLLQMAENEVRKALDPVALAETVLDLHTKQGLTLLDIAAKLGRSKMWGSNMHKLAVNATKEVKKALKEGTITLKDAYMLVELSAEEQLDTLARMTGAAKEDKRATRKKVHQQMGRVSRPALKEQKAFGERVSDLASEKKLNPERFVGFQATMEWILGASSEDDVLSVLRTTRA